MAPPPYGGLISQLQRGVRPVEWRFRGSAGRTTASALAHASPPRFSCDAAPCHAMLRAAVPSYAVLCRA
eukprot:7584055-Pyramimonas_sp.AAC.1